MNSFMSGFADELVKTSAADRTYLTPKSSNIKGFSYNAKTQELSVTFKGGSQYKYKGVPNSAFRGLRRNKSTGKSLNRLIKAKGYEYEKTAKRESKNYKCRYCKDPATKGVIWAEGKGIVPCCDKHLEKGKNSIEDQSDINTVRDLTKTAENAPATKAFIRSRTSDPNSSGAKYYAKKRREKRKQQEANRLLKKAGLLPDVQQGNSSYLIGRITEKRRQIEKIAGVCVRTLTWSGLTMKFEYLKGDIRTGTGEGGKKWSRKMRDCYGYIPGTYGQGADGEAIDVYFHHAPLDGPVFKIRQLTKEGKFDEDKFMVGYGTSKLAKIAFSRNMPPWAFGDITSLPMKSFRTIVGQNGNRVRVPLNNNTELERVRRAMERKTK